ncbi:MAG: hypothetical protein HY613_09210 [Candidatus Rokubacteria bacterium]|nr:hypothetical protein [Candidatus Rokubacteria bacterium]
MTFWPAGSALAMAACVLALVLPETRSRRLSNLDIGPTGFPDTYIMFSKSERGRCFVVDRRDSTTRRYDPNTPGRKWDCSQFRVSDRPGGLDAWFVRSKRAGKGTVFFVPVEEVRDWTYPFLYNFVRERRPELNLPPVGWTQLFVNRIYHGLYLRVALPFDPRKKDGGSGILQEILTVRGDRLAQIDTRFHAARRLYMDSVAASRFPALRDPSPALAWLARRCPTDATTLLMSNQPPHDLSLLPLPVSLPDLYEALYGRPPHEFKDGRLAQWSRGPWRAETASLPFADSELATLRSEFEEHARSFSNALRSHAEFHRTLTATRALLPQRQHAAAGLLLRLEEM